MKSLAIFGAETKLTNAHKLVTSKLQPKYYVRVKVMDGPCEDTLFTAKPMKGEGLLNTIDITEGMEMPNNPLRKK